MPLQALARVSSPVQGHHQEFLFWVMHICVLCHHCFLFMFPSPILGKAKTHVVRSTRGFGSLTVQKSFNQITGLSYNILVYQRQISCILKNLRISGSHSPDFQAYMHNQNILQHLGLTLSWVSCNLKLFFFCSYPRYSFSF